MHFLLCLPIVRSADRPDLRCQTVNTRDIIGVARIFSGGALFPQKVNDLFSRRPQYKAITDINYSHPPVLPNQHKFPKNIYVWF